MFGATGDLAGRKLLPGLFQLAAAGLMPDRYQIIGSSRRHMTDEQFREHARQAVAEFGTTKPTGAAWHAFTSRLSFASADPVRTLPLVEAIGRAEHRIGGAPGKLFHLAVPPAAFEPTVGMLGAAGLALGSRVIIEKPFGTAATLLAGVPSCPRPASPKPSTASESRLPGSRSWLPRHPPPAPWRRALGEHARNIID